MGLRFRKSVKIAPGVKVNLNKKSTSVTFGGKGVHRTISSTGKKISYSSVGSDGDPYDDLEEQLMSNTDFGVYGFDDDHKKKQSPNKGNNGNKPKKPKKKTGCLPLVCALIVLFVLVSFLVGHKSIEKINISADTDTEYHVGDSIPIEAKVTPSDAKLDDFKNDLSGGTLEKDGDKITFTPSKTGSFKLYVGSDGVKSNEITVDVVDPAETADVSDDTADYDYDDSSDIDDSSDVADDTSDDVTPDPIVYITDTGSKYHRADCRTLKDSKIEKHLSEVKGSYQPCGVCHPPQ